MGFHTVDGVWNLRHQRPYNVFTQVLKEQSKKFEMRILQFSVQSNHVHLIVEARNKQAVARRMKGFLVSLAKRMNRLMGRRGQVIEDRHFTRIVWSRRGAVKLMRYVRENHRKHTGPPDAWKTGVTIDPRSSWARHILLPSPRTYSMYVTDPFG